tara:strand:- start:858 stop:1340 length:483 start_codon:yes stop_codon:yes gene_type:complete
MSDWLLELTKPIPIEVGKTYLVEPCYKKSVEEFTSFFAKTSGKDLEYGRQGLVCKTVWRGGSFNITPQDEEEVEMLIFAQTDLDGVEITGFENMEFLNTYDGCSEDLMFYNVPEDEEKIHTAGWEEDGYGYFEELNWKEQNEIYISVPVLCTLVEDTVDE